MKKKPIKTNPSQEPASDTRLNKFIANAGIASRRKAAEIIASGKVKVNGKTVLEPGFRIQKQDKVEYEGKLIKPEKHVYILLNKPKDFITTLSDDRGRKTVMQLVKKATDSRIYPVGRLDRMTTGLLLFTNDGELALNLTHPSKKVEKLYAVTLDKPLFPTHFEEIKKGLTLEDGFAAVDDIAYTDEGDKRKIGIKLHIGKNRIVRRIFESLGYDVKRLDRSVYAGLTKKDLPRGKWRYLKDREVIRLKHFT